MCQILQHFPFFRTAVKAKLELLTGAFWLELLTGALSQRNTCILIDSSFFGAGSLKADVMLSLKKKKNPPIVKMQILNTNFSNY